MLKQVVATATKQYKSKRPKEPQVDTAYGDLPLSALYDKKSKWQLITQAYVQILSAVSAIDKKLDREIEIAKLVSTNPILRNITKPNHTATGIL